MISVTAWCLFGTPQEDWPRLFKFIRSSGFEGIELHVEPAPWPITPEKNDALPWLLTSIDDANLKVTSFSTMIHIQNPITAKDTVVQCKAIEVVEKMLDLVHAVGGKNISVAPGGKDCNWTNALPIIKKLNIRAKNMGIRFLLENVWYSFSRDINKLWELFNALDDSNIGICLDVGNTLPYGSIEKWISRFNKSINKVHISDAVIDKKATICPLGHGNVDWNFVAQTLHSINFSGDLTLELFPSKEYSIPRELIRSYRFIKKYF